MTFPNRGTRRLYVDGVEYLWHIALRDVDYGGVLATIRAVSGGPLLHYRMEEFPSGREAEAMIRFAIRSGWEQCKPGSAVWVEQYASGLTLSTGRPTNAGG